MQFLFPKQGTKTAVPLKHANIRVTDVYNLLPKGVSLISVGITLYASLILLFISQLNDLLRFNICYKFVLINRLIIIIIILIEICTL